MVKKRHLRLSGIEEKIVTLYARGMTVRNIEETLRELHGVEVSHSLITQITKNMLDEARAWQSRPLEAIYPIVWLDEVMVKVRRKKQVINKCVHVVLGVNMRGEREVLGIWLAESREAEFWRPTLTDLRNRGVEDIVIVCMDGLPGLPEAIHTAFPRALTQLSVVHLIRASLRYAASADSRALAAGLKQIYQSQTVDEAERELHAFAEIWGETYPSIIQIWHNDWGSVSSSFRFPPEICRIVCTVYAIESLNSRMRKLTQNGKIFPDDESVLESFSLSIHEIVKKWRSIHHWKPALQSFQAMFGNDRIPLSGL